jgi:rubrerythrin
MEMDLKSLMSKVVELEGSLSVVYQKIAERFRSDPEAEELFSQLSSEESNHKEIASFERRVIMANGALFYPVEIDEKAFEYVTAKMKRLSNDNLTIDEIVNLCVKLEDSMSEHYVFIAAGKTNKRFGKFIVQMSSESLGHANKVIEFAKKRGIILTKHEKEEKSPERPRFCPVV